MRLPGCTPCSAHAELEQLCSGLGPYLLLVSLTKIQDMAKMMAVPGTECVCCASEEVRLCRPRASRNKLTV